MIIYLLIFFYKFLFYKKRKNLNIKYKISSINVCVYVILSNVGYCPTYSILNNIIKKIRIKNIKNMNLKIVDQF